MVSGAAIGAPAASRQAPARRRWRRCGRLVASPLVLAAVLLVGCGRDIELHTGLSEADANELVVALAAAGVPAGKSTKKQGLSITVPADQLSFAVSVLRAQGLPRYTFARMGDIFKKDGMISSPMEERGRYLFALSQELESTLSQIDGVVLAKVHPVLPERTLPGETAQASSCAVFIKHRPDFDPALYEDRIRQLVLAGIPGLGNTADREEQPRPRVSVVFSPVVAAVRNASAPGDPAPGAQRAVAIGLAVLALGGLLGMGYVFRTHIAALWSRVRKGVTPARPQPESQT